MIWNCQTAAPSPGGLYAPITYGSGAFAISATVAGHGVVNTPIPMTIKALGVDSATAAGDSTEKWNLLVNGTPTGESVTIVNGTTTGATTGLSVNIVSGDLVTWQYDSGASGAVGQCMLAIYAEKT